MNKSFILKGVALPLICAVLIGICFYFAVSKNAKAVSPVIADVPLAYHDELASGDKKDVFATVKSEGEIQLIYDADYSSLLEYASVKPQSAELGETGCIYVNISEINMAKVSTSKPLVIEKDGREYTYEYKSEKLVSSESDALSISPAGEKSLVVYYRVSNGIGLTSDYYALIYKEVS